MASTTGSCSLADPVEQGVPNADEPNEAPDLPSVEGGFGTVLADPPWRFHNRTGKIAPEHRRLSRYDTMDAKEIAALPVGDVTAGKSHCYLWVPNALLADGLMVLEQWGFTYKANLVWAKRRKDGGPDGRGVGFYFRNVTELILFGVKGNLRTGSKARSMVNIIETRKREHSRKPDEQYDIIEAVSPGPYLELFARYPREGWHVWGHEAPPDVVPRGRQYSAYGAPKHEAGCSLASGAGMQLTESYERVVPARIRHRYTWAETRNATEVIATTNPSEFDDVLRVLDTFRVDVDRDLIAPGGNHSQAARLLNGMFRELGWREGSYRVSFLSRLTLRPYRQAGERQAITSDREVDADSYRIDNLKARVAVDVEWHAKDGNLDRDIAVYSALYDEGVIDAAVIVTVNQGEMKGWAREVAPGTTKFNTSTTTNVEKALPRLRRGDGGGCPIVVVGIGRNTV